MRNYEKLQEVAEQIHRHGMVITNGDIIAKVGKLVFETVMGRHGMRSVIDENVKS